MLNNVFENLFAPGKTRANLTSLWKIAAAVLLLILIFLFRPLVVIDAGHRGVVTNFGKVLPEILGEGLHWRIPVMQNVHEINVQIRKGEGAGDAASKDLQSVHTQIAINYHLDPAAVATTYQEIGDLSLVDERIIQPAVQEAVKASTAKFTAEELITKRAEVRDDISSFMKDRLNRHGIILDEFSITNFAFSTEFNAAIEAKVTAEQDTLKAQQVLNRVKIDSEQKVVTAKAEAEAKIVSAQADAEALRLQKQEISPLLIELRNTDNTRMAISKWNGVLPTTTSGAVPFINVGEK